MIEKLVHSGLDTLVSASEIRSGIWLKDKKNFNVKKIIDPNIPNLVKKDYTLKVSIGHGCVTYPLNLNTNSIFSKKYDFHISNSNTEFFEISNFQDKDRLEDFIN